jgi:hypothetical protein
MLFGGRTACLRAGLRRGAAPRWISLVGVCVLGVAGALAVSWGCGASHAVSDSDIPLVRNGFLPARPGDAGGKAYGRVTIGKALERKFPNGRWREFAAPDGLVVEFDAAVLPATLYQHGFPVWAPFLKKGSGAEWGVPGETGSLSLRAASTCLNDERKRVAVSPHGGRIVIDCRLLFQIEFLVAADRRRFGLRYISLATFDTDDEARVIGYVWG